MGTSIFHEQGFDIVDVTPYLLVVRTAAQRHQRPGDDVDEAPGELLEGSRVAFAGQLVGDPGGHLGDTREVADGVVAGRDLGKAQMEHVEVLGPSGPLGLGVDASQQAGVTLGIEDDHHVPAPDVLGDEDLGQSGLADPGGPQHQGVPHPLAEIHPHVLFVRLDRVQGRLAPDGRQGRQRVPPGADPEQARQQAQDRDRFPGDLLAACPLIERTRLDITLDLRPDGIAQALGVFLGPAETPPQKELTAAERNLARS